MTWIALLAAALALACMGLGYVSHRLARRLRDEAAAQAERDAVRDQKLKELVKRLDTYVDGSVRMGEELHELALGRAYLPCPISRSAQPRRIEPAVGVAVIGQPGDVPMTDDQVSLTNQTVERSSARHRGAPSRSPARRARSAMGL